MAAGATPDGTFGPARQISPLGTTIGDTPLAVAVSDRGARLVAWKEGEAGVDGEGALIAVRGDAGRDRPTKSDHRGPRLGINVSLACLQAAATGAPLDIDLTCDEACGVRVTVHSMADETLLGDDYRGLDDLRAVALQRSDGSSSRWQLTREQRRRLARVLRIGSVWVVAHATNRAGNTRVVEHRLL
jgi:hypothetical protein